MTMEEGPVSPTHKAVRQKILVPILLATIVTVFSLHYYNQVHAERLMAKKTKIKQDHHLRRHSVGRDSQRKLFRRELNPTLQGGAEGKFRGLAQSWQTKLPSPVKGAKTRNSASKFGVIMKPKPHGIGQHLDVAAHIQSSITTEAERFKRLRDKGRRRVPYKTMNLNISQPSLQNVAISITTTGRPGGRNESKPGIARYKPGTSRPVTNRSQLEAETGSLHKELKYPMTLNISKNVILPISLLASKSNVWHKQYQKGYGHLKKGTPSTINGTTKKASVGWNKGKPFHLSKIKHSKDNNVSRASSSASLFKSRRLLERRLLKIIDKRTVNLHNQSSPYVSGINESSWNKMKQTERLKKLTFPLPVPNEDSAKDLLNVLASMHMPLNKSHGSYPESISEGTTERVNITSDEVEQQIATNPPLNEPDHLAKQQVMTKLSSVSSSTSFKYWQTPKPHSSPDLQQIWDNSIHKLDSSAPSKLTQMMHHRRYSSNKLSLQQIWDESVSGSVTEHPGLVQKHNQVTSATVHTEHKANVTFEQIAIGANTPDVSLSSADLPLKSMRSTIMQFSYKPIAGVKYAVISIGVIGTDYNYAFSVPFTVVAWQRIGYGVIVFIVGTEEKWVASPVLHYILKTLRRLDPVVLFFDAPEDNWVFLSQTSRIFASTMLDWRGMEATPLVMSDVDIWPLSREMYDIPASKKILSLNSDCCGSFVHHGHTYKMLPLCNVAMSVNTWRELIRFGLDGAPQPPTSASEIISYFHAEFGDVATGAVKKGENDAWFLDQHLVSVRVAQWQRRHGDQFVQFAPRDVGRDRVDRSHWSPYRLTRMNDVHLLENFYQPGTWERALPLLRQMFNEKVYLELEQYREGFIRMLVDNVGHG